MKAYRTGLRVLILILVTLAFLPGSVYSGKAGSPLPRILHQQAGWPHMREAVTLS
jgi:hypothetical protein